MAFNFSFLEYTFKNIGKKLLGAVENFFIAY